MSYNNIDIACCVTDTKVTTSKEAIYWLIDKVEE